MDELQAKTIPALVYPTPELVELDQDRLPLPSDRRQSMLVGIVTLKSAPWELEDNFCRLEVYVREAAGRRAQVIVAPESVLDGYVFNEDPTSQLADMLKIAQTAPDGSYIQRSNHQPQRGIALGEVRNRMRQRTVRPLAATGQKALCSTPARSVRASSRRTAGRLLR